MTVIEALVLGIVQGLTEFLPVSSSGHLVIIDHLIGAHNQGATGLAFYTALHMGTLLAVMWAFWPDIMEILKRPFSRLTGLIIITCIPAALMGFFLEPLFEKAFESLLVVGIALLVTGILLYASEKLNSQRITGKDWETTTYTDALFIGILQGLAIIPGLSRSGSTIAGALFCGLEREKAARFSFLVSIPVILGAGILEMKDISFPVMNFSDKLSFIVGPLAAMLTGYLAIRLVLRLVKKGRLSLFSYYVWGLGLLTIAWHFAR